ncbi:MAG: hypothetical protein ACRC1J_07835 [Sandaracinobacteroides sp.]
MHIEAMRNDDGMNARKIGGAGQSAGETNGLDRIVTAIAFLTTVGIILLSPFG